MLNSEMMRKDEGLAAAQQWVRRVIQENPARYVVVMEHYQWFFATTGRTSQYERWHDLRGTGLPNDGGASLRPSSPGLRCAAGRARIDSATPSVLLFLYLCGRLAAAPQHSRGRHGGPRGTPGPQGQSVSLHQSVWYMWLIITCLPIFIGGRTSRASLQFEVLQQPLRLYIPDVHDAIADGISIVDYR